MFVLPENYMLDMRGWEATKIEHLDVRLQGTLFSLVKRTHWRLRPSGQIRCACCQQVKAMDDANPVFYRMAVHVGVVCHACAASDMPFEVFASEEGMSSIANKILATHIQEPAITPEAMHAFGHKIADANGCTYLNNQTIEDIRASLLARRVIRHWRSTMERQHRKRTAWFLYVSGALDMHASHAMSKRIRW